MKVFHDKDPLVIEGTRLVVEAGDTSTPDEYFVLPNNASIAVVVDSYVVDNHIRYDILTLDKLRAGLGIADLYELATHYTVVHTVYVLKLAIALVDEKWQRRRLERLYRRDCDRLRGIKPIEEACRAAYEKSLQESNRVEV